MATPALKSDLIPSGSWSLWYHSPNETKWTKSTYKLIASVKTWTEFWTLIDSLGDDALLNGFFFFMQDPIQPLWEDKHNIHGGSYSMRISARDSADLFLKYIIGAMVGEITTSSENRITGVNISPKRGFNVINIWNQSAKGHNKREDIVPLSRVIGADEIRFMPHTERNFR
jgi:hypothetical protein